MKKSLYDLGPAWLDFKCRHTSSTDSCQGGVKVAFGHDNSYMTSDLHGWIINLTSSTDSYRGDVRVAVEHKYVI